MPPPPVDIVAWRSLGGIDVMTWPALEELEVEVVMTTRHGGVSSGPYGSLNLSLCVGDEDHLVLENRRRAAGAVGAELSDLVFCNQAHGQAVAVVTQTDKGRGATSTRTGVEATDAAVTAEVGPVLVTMVADCVPIALYSPAAHVAGAVHAGWRGTALRVAAAAVEAMARLGAPPDDLVAAIGPAADPDRYQVGPEVMEAMWECFGGDTDDLARPDPAADGAYLLDLWEANRRILVEAGVRPDRVLLSGVPSGNDGPFFSHRAARPCGRNALLVRLRPRS